MSLLSTDSSSQPSVKFPKDLLTLAGNASVPSLSAYLTVPIHHLARDCANCTPAIVGNQSGGLSPSATVLFFLVGVIRKNHEY